MSKENIVVVGGCNTDFVLDVAHFPAPGETVVSKSFNTFGGGKGANQGVAAARLGANVTLIARVGNDERGRNSVKFFQSEGIQTDHITFDDDLATGLAMIAVNEKGENTIVVSVGANSRLLPQDIHNAEAAFRSAKAVLLQLEVPLETVTAAVKTAHKHGVAVILNPAPAIPLSAELLSQVDYLTPNETELIALIGNSADADVDAAALELKKSVGTQHLIVTLGSKGAMIAGQPKQIIPAFPVDAVDTTAAGDAFNGGLAVSLAQGKSLADSVRYANAVGAISTTRPGAQPSLPSVLEVERFLRERPSPS
ncbi:MAG: ribokinase [Chloroflexi bacterium]|nr:ribokinase [Chloroflexota bacterium]